MCLFLILMNFLNHCNNSILLLNNILNSRSTHYITVVLLIEINYYLQGKLVVMFLYSKNLVQKYKSSRILLESKYFSLSRKISVYTYLLSLKSKTECRLEAGILCGKYRILQNRFLLKMYHSSSLPRSVKEKLYTDPTTNECLILYCYYNNYI